MVRRAALAVPVLALVAVAAPLTGAAADGAFVTHENLSGTATFPIDNPCNGETFLATSTFQFVTTIYSTPSGISGKADIGVFHGSGDTADGAHYVFTTVGTLVPIVFEAGPNAHEVIVGINPTFHFVRTGPDGTREDFFFHVELIAHIDLDTGTVTLQAGHSSTECR
jgi:hypothetical protein